MQNNNNICGFDILIKFTTISPKPKWIIQLTFFGLDSIHFHAILTVYHVDSDVRVFYYAFHSMFYFFKHRPYP